MITLPSIIDALDIFKYEDSDGIDKIASKINNDDIQIPFEEDIKHLKMDEYACIIKTAEGNLFKFPINSRDNTLLNIHALMHTHETLPDEIVKTASSNLKKAAEFWSIEDKNISDYLDTIKVQNVDNNIVNFERFDERKFLEKLASFNEDAKYEVFALDGKYPLDTPGLMKQAEYYFKQYNYLFDPIEQYTFATNFIKQAEILNFYISEKSIEKYAHLSYEKNAHLEQFLIARDSKTTTDNAYREILKVADKVSLEKLAEAIFELDREFGYDVHYNKLVPDPIFTVFNSLEKKSEDPVSAQSLQSIPKEALENIGLTADTIEELQGDNGMDVFHSLPDPVIEQIIDVI